MNKCKLSNKSVDNYVGKAGGKKMRGIKSTEILKTELRLMFFINNLRQAI